MLRIRLQRIGRHKRPFYRIVVTDVRRKRGGPVVAILGWYDPLLKQKPKYKLDKKAYDSWVEKGAQPSDAVLRLILSKKEKQALWPDKAPAKKEEASEEALAQEESSTEEKGENNEAKQEAAESQE